MTAGHAITSGLIDYRFLDDLPQQRVTPDWVRREPLACVGGWEPLFHRRRRGNNTVDDEELFAYEHSEPFVRELIDAGVSIMITSYCKSLYIDESEYLLKKELAAHCKKHGLRLAVYIRCDNVYAERLADEIRTRDVLAQRADGRVPIYGREEYRPCTCFHKPDTMAWFKEAIRRAIEDLGVDALHLDGFIVGGMETVDACRCEACRRDFTAFLKRRYDNDPDMARRRFGFAELDAIQPPGMIVEPLMPLGQVVDPVWQEWIIFRCTWTARVAREIAEFVYDLNPDVGIFVNNAVAVRENTAILLGTDLPSLGEGADDLMIEDGYGPQITDDGRIIQRIRQHKLARSCDAFVWNYMNRETVAELQLAMSESVALNRGRINHIGDTEGVFPTSTFRLHTNAKKTFLDWTRDHWAHFQAVEPVADVAVWREARAMAFAPHLAYATAMQIEQLLIEEHLPFSLAIREWTADTRVVVLPGLACLDDALCQRVVEFVEQGGSAMIVGDTSMRDGWGRLRRDLGLRALLPASVNTPGLHAEQHIAAAGAAMPEVAALTQSSEDIYHQVGRGRVVYVPSVVDPASQPSLFNPDNTYDTSLDLTNWRVPERADELRRAFDWLLDDQPTMGVTAPRGVIAEYDRKPDDGSYYAHIVNMTGEAVSDVAATLVLPGNRRTTAVRILSPDADGDRQADWQASGAQVTATVGRVLYYAMVVFETTE